MRYLVTGAGMLGTALAEGLRAAGHEVVVLDVAPGDGVVVADLRDPGTLAPALDGVDGVFHTAALHGWRQNPPREFLDVNVVGTWNLCEAMVAAGVRRLVHSSTVGVYGAAPHIEIGPDTPPTQGGDHYNLTKLMAEQVVRFHAETHGIDACALRYGGFAQLIETTYGSLTGGWAQSGAIVDLEDLVAANLLAMEKLPTPRFGYVVIPTGGTDESPYKVDASGIEQDLGFTFRHSYESILARSTAPVASDRSP